MDKAVSAAGAKRNFSRLLENVRRGRSYVVISRGEPIAKIFPVDEAERIAASARVTLLVDCEAVRNQGCSLDARRTLRGSPLRVALDTNVLAYAEAILSKLTFFDVPDLKRTR